VSGPPGCRWGRIWTSVPHLVGTGKRHTHSLDREGQKLQLSRRHMSPAAGTNTLNVSTSFKRPPSAFCSVCLCARARADNPKARARGIFPCSPRLHHRLGFPVEIVSPQDTLGIFGTVCEKRMKRKMIAHRDALFLFISLGTPFRYCASWLLCGSWTLDHYPY